CLRRNFLPGGLSAEAAAPGHCETAPQLWRQFRHSSFRLEPLSKNGVWIVGAMWFSPSGRAAAGNAERQRPFFFLVYSAEHHAQTRPDPFERGSTSFWYGISPQQAGRTDRSEERRVGKECR